MFLYLETQLEQAYRVYITKIPFGQKIPDIEFFREMLEEMSDADYFEELLDEWERLEPNSKSTN
mgnify:CR=1 FL=1|jgi:hypothetical protein|tara:strand:+ start:244 stop:435 length:192 start_codon:yes stop_codon:yes gene_type:complete